MTEMKKTFYLLPVLLFVVITACDGGSENGLGSDISQACAGQFAGFLDGIQRGSLCMCEGEFRGEFSLNLGPAPPEGSSFTIGLGRTTFGVEEKDETTISLFNTARNPEGFLVIEGEPVGELQNLEEGLSSLQFVISLGDDPQERVVCPACFTGPLPLECDIEEEIDKPKCLDRETLVETGSSCPTDAIVRVCSPYFCSGSLFNEDSGAGIVIDGFQLPSKDSGSRGCNTITDGSFEFTDIEVIPPAGTMTGPIPEDGIGEGSFACQLEFPGF